MRAGKMSWHDSRAWTWSCETSQQPWMISSPRMLSNGFHIRICATINQPHRLQPHFQVVIGGLIPRSKTSDVILWRTPSPNPERDRRLARTIPVYPAPIAAAGQLTGSPVRHPCRLSFPHAAREDGFLGGQTQISRLVGVIALLGREGAGWDVIALVLAGCPKVAMYKNTFPCTLPFYSAYHNLIQPCHNTADKSPAQIINDNPHFLQRSIQSQTSHRKQTTSRAVASHHHTHPTANMGAVVSCVSPSRRFSYLPQPD